MKRKTDEQIKEELRAIYAGHDGEIPDMTKLEKREGSRLTRLLIRLIILLGILSAIAWVGFFVWSRGGIGPERPLETSADAPESVLSGQETFYTFRYENGGNSPIASLQAKLTLPADFTLTSANPPPTDEAALTWTLGSLSRGSDGAITVGGIFRSEVPSTQTIQTLFTYRPGNFSSDFQDIATTRVDIEDSVLDATLSGPEKALPGDEVTYVVNVQNSGTLETTGVFVAAVLPDGFAITSADPPADESGTSAWTFDAFSPGELKAITINGRYTATVEGEQTMKARVSLLNEQKTEFLQTEAEAKTDVLGGAVAFGLMVNGSPSGQTADPGDTLRISVDYANNGNETVRGLAFALALSGDGDALPIDWTRASLSGATRSGNTLTWDGTAVPSFAEFSPSVSGVIDLSLPILTELDVPGMSNALTLSLTATLDQIGAIESPRSVDASPVTVRINSDFRSSAHAEYYTADGESVGTGPLPPAVGQTTAYRIVWRIANTFHPLENVRMTTNLPPKVAWTGKTGTEIGTITFDETTRVVTWSIPSLPLSIPGAEATFEVAITPEEIDVGAFYKLTNAIAVEATDAFTDDQVADGIDVLTSELPDDAGAAGKGVVAE